MAPKTKDVTSLPQKGQWHCYVHKLRAWVSGDDGLPVRPYLMLVVNTEVGERTERTMSVILCIVLMSITTSQPLWLKMEMQMCFFTFLFSVVGGEEGVRYPEDGAFLACEPGETDDEAGGGNVVKELPSSKTVLTFLKRVMTHPRLMNTSKAGEKRAPGRPKSVRFANTATAALHLGDKDKWAGETACPYVEGCKGGLAELGVEDCSFAPVPQQLIQEIIRGQIEPNMVRLRAHTRELWTRRGCLCVFCWSTPLGCVTTTPPTAPFVSAVRRLYFLSYTHALFCCRRRVCG